MGARKSGRSLEGSEWLETWEEKFSKDGVTSEPCVERAAHKWCRMAGETVNEWEEQWCVMALVGPSAEML